MSSFKGLITILGITAFAGLGGLLLLEELCEKKSPRKVSLPLYDENKSEDDGEIEMSEMPPATAPYSIEGDDDINNYGNESKNQVDEVLFDVNDVNDANDVNDEFSQDVQQEK